MTDTASSCRTVTATPSPKSKSCAGGSGAMSPHLVLPPIVGPDRDGRFLRELCEYIEKELDCVDRTNPNQRYIVYRAAFNRIIDHVTAYKPLLTAIKAEYEVFIDAIVRGRQEAFYLNGKLKAMASEVSTVHNYRRRCDELIDRMNIVRSNNEILQDELLQIRARKSGLQHSRSRTTSWIDQTSRIVSVSSTSGPTIIPGLSVEESTDVRVLEREVAKLDRLLKELVVSRDVQYKPRCASDHLQHRLYQKELLKEHIAREERALQRRVLKLQVANEAAKLYNQLLGYCTQESIGDVIIEALRRFRRSRALEKEGRVSRHDITTVGGDEVDEDDDPVRRREAEALVDYIRRFMQLFDERNYAAAALHAANSPNGVLRTMETLRKFAGAVAVHVRDPPPLLLYCTAIMASVRALSVLPPGDMARQCVHCALENGKFELLAHWVGQNLLVAEEGLGDMVSAYCRCQTTRSTNDCVGSISTDESPAVVSCVCYAQAIAQCLYVSSQCYMKAMLCMLGQGRVLQAYEYGRTHSVLDKATAVTLLRQRPSQEFARLLAAVGDNNPQSTADSILSVSMAASVLMETMPNAGCRLLEETLREPGGRRRLFMDVESGELTEDDWWRIAETCNGRGFDDVAIHVTAAVTVATAVEMAVARLTGKRVMFQTD